MISHAEKLYLPQETDLPIYGKKRVPSPFSPCLVEIQGQMETQENTVATPVEHVSVDIL